MLAAFFDDSGTHSTSPVVSIGGLLGTEEQWEAFEAAWADLLARPLPGKPRLTQFHLTQCRGGHGEFQDYNRAERDRLTYLFRQVILEIGLVTVAVAVNRIAWNDLIVGDIASELGPPEQLCFYKCIELVMNTIRFRKPGQNILIAFDQGTKPQLGDFAKWCLLQRDKYPEIIDIRFEKVSDVLQLQGADMIALETYQFGQAWLRDREHPQANAHFRDYLKRELSVGLIFDREQIEEIVERLRETLSRSVTQ